MGQLATAFKDPNPEFTTKRNVKSGSIEQMLNDLYTADNQRSQANSDILNNFTRQWQGGQAQYRDRANQEIGSLDQFYNGGMEGKLAAIRGARRKAYTDATARAVADINRNRSIGFLGGDTPNNSYGNRLAFRQAGDAEIALGLDDVNQQKADLNYLTGNQINLAGRRGGIQDSVLQRLLVPMGLQNQELARREGNLGNLSNIDKSNTFYGLTENKGAIDQVGTFLDGIAQVASIYYGGGGGGGGSKGGGTDGFDLKQYAATPYNQGGGGGGGGGAGQRYFSMPTGNYDSEHGGGYGLGGNPNQNSWSGMSLRDLNGGNYDSEAFGGLSY